MSKLAHADTQRQSTIVMVALPLKASCQVALLGQCLIARRIITHVYACDINLRSTSKPTSLTPTQPQPLTPAPSSKARVHVTSSSKHILTNVLVQWTALRFFHCNCSSCHPTKLQFWPSMSVHVTCVNECRHKFVVLVAVASRQVWGHRRTSAHPLVARCVFSVPGVRRAVEGALRILVSTSLHSNNFHTSVNERPCSKSPCVS